MNKSSNDKIADALGIEPIDYSPEDKMLPEPVEAKTKLEILRDKPLEEIIIDEDFNEARDNLKDLFRRQLEVIDRLTMIAEETENPRHFETLAPMMKNALEMNDRLLGINKQRKELTKGLPVPKGAPQVIQSGDQKIEVQNAVFVGTSADLDKLLEERRNKQNAQQLPTQSVQPKE